MSDKLAEKKVEPGQPGQTGQQGQGQQRQPGDKATFKPQGQQIRKEGDSPQIRKEGEGQQEAKIAEKY